MFLLNNICLFLIWMILIVVCYTDIRFRIIHNSIVITIFIIILANFLIGSGELNYIAALIFFVIGLLIFCFNIMGAGDIKLIIVLLLSLPTKEIWDFFTLMTFLGLPLAIIALIRKIITKSTVTIPYGVAISLSYIIITYLKLAL